MKKFRMRWTEVHEYQCTVEADSQEEAEAKLMAAIHSFEEPEFDCREDFIGCGDDNITECKQVPTVIDVTLPISTYGFRSGWAYATVNGEKKRVYTSESSTVDYHAHKAAITRRFEQGHGLDY